MQRNCEAQEESLRRREDLIKELELERELRLQEREQQESRRTTWLQDINAQVGLKCKVLGSSVLNVYKSNPTFQ